MKSRLDSFMYSLGRFSVIGASAFSGLVTVGDSDRVLSRGVVIKICRPRADFLAARGL
jgi:hypothetical protein